jgi:hypothetical protein
MVGQILDFVTVGRGQEGFEIIILWSFTVTLNEAVIRLWAAALFEAKRLLGDGKASPPAIAACPAAFISLMGLSWRCKQSFVSLQVRECRPAPRFFVSH